MTRLVLIGVAGVDWPGLSARMQDGRAPKLAALAARGVGGWLRSAPPRQGPAAWTGVATGQLPETHRVLQPDEAWPGGLRPLSMASWRSPPVWATLQAAGVSTASVAWPGARPGADTAGLHIDEDFAEPNGADWARWSLPLHCAPAAARAELADLRTHPTDITGAMLAPLVPELDSIAQGRDTALPRLAVAMAKAATVQAAAAWVLESAPPALFVHLGWLGDVRDVFEGARSGPFAGVVDGAWRFLDSLVGRLAELAGPETLVMVVSPGRYTGLGALIAAGPGVSPGTRLTQASVLDIAPSVLAHFGLQDAGLPGQAIPALAPPGPRRLVPTPQPPAPVAPDLALLASAADAGYPPPAQVPAAWRAQGPAELAAAVVERDPNAAIRLAEEALRHDPEHPLALTVKVMAHVAIEDAEPLAELAETLLRVAPERGWGPLAHAVRYLLAGVPDAASPWLRRAQLDKRPEFLLRVATIWFGAGRPTEAARIFKRVAKMTPEDPSAHLGVGMAALSQRQFLMAEAAFREALRLDPSRWSAHLQLAYLYGQTGRLQDAARAADAAAVLGASPEQVRAAVEGRMG